MNRPPLVIILIALAAVLSFSGCARFFAKRSTPAVNRSQFAVKTETTPFYRYGPQQGNGPDRELPRDTVVTVIRQSMGYSKVRLDDGVQGFVSSEDLKRAPEKLIAHVDTPARLDFSNLPPPPPVQLPTADPPSPEFEPTPLPQSLMP
jgi:hypothetical protein